MKGCRALMRIALSFSVALIGALAMPAGTAAAEEPPTHSCNWISKAALADGGNWLWPDESANYVLGIFQIPRDGHVELKGEFPHSRYLSFQSFDLGTHAFDLVQDIDIKPDAGSINPFRTNANRASARRAYTLKIVDGRVPERQRPSNTMYTQARNGSPGLPGLAIVLLRSYLPDSGRDSTGDVGWPIVTSVGADDARRPAAGCPALQLPTATTPLLRNLSSPVALPDLGISGHSPPRWFRAWDSYPEMVLNTLRSPATDLLPMDRIGESLPGTSIGNLATGYVAATFSQTHGEVLVLTGRAPTHPRTYHGEASMKGGEVRYWSFCANTDTTQYVGCLYDEQVPLDANGHYRIVVSPASSRPDNARTSCGFAWLPSTPRSLIILRNILADPAFAHGIKNVTRRGDEERVLGEYYPRGTYYGTPSEVERLGCGANSDRRVTADPHQATERHEREAGDEPARPVGAGPQDEDEQPRPETARGLKLPDLLPIDRLATIR